MLPRRLLLHSLIEVRDDMDMDALYSWDIVVDGTDEEREGEVDDDDCILSVLPLLPTFPLLVPPLVAVTLGLLVRFCTNLSVIFFSSIRVLKQTSEGAMRGRDKKES